MGLGTEEGKCKDFRTNESLLCAWRKHALLSPETICQVHTAEEMRPNCSVWNHNACGRTAMRPPEAFATTKPHLEDIPLVGSHNGCFLTSCAGRHSHRGGFHPDAAVEFSLPLAQRTGK